MKAAASFWSGGDKSRYSRQSSLPLLYLDICERCVCVVALVTLDYRKENRFVTV